jgi:hypothetical protein
MAIAQTKEEGVNTLTISAPPLNIPLGKVEVIIDSESMHYKYYTKENVKNRIAMIKVTYKESRPFDVAVLSGENEFASTYSKGETINCFVEDIKSEKNNKTYKNATV